ncbi:hypothetical protein [Sphingobium yanoikuyae]|uniref:hypothetical protein n=1 Tax=Sphingobium yanoikuyae TaxID=13690 RepID=UPI00345E9F2C
MAGKPVQPCLFRVLVADDCTMLTPVLDSLTHLYALGLGRPILAGDGPDISEDGHPLGNLHPVLTREGRESVEALRPA